MRSLGNDIAAAQVEVFGGRLDLVKDFVHGQLSGFEAQGSAFHKFFETGTKFALVPFAFRYGPLQP